MKIVFMGTPALAVPFVEALRQEHNIVLVVTQPDKPQGRGRDVQAPPLKKWANEYSIPVAQPERARNPEFIAQLQAVQPDAIAVVAYGQILPNAILELPRVACLNAHFSLLPRWRGAAPVQHALMAGDTVTGVTIQHMAEKLDAGDIVLQREYTIGAEETTADLWQNLTPIGAQALAEALRLLEKGEATRTPQDEAHITVARQLTREDGHIRWTNSAADIVNRVRGTNPWPGAWLTFRGQNLKIWRASREEGKNTTPGSVLSVDAEGVLVAASEGAVRLREVQSEGRPRMAAGEWARGARLERGEPFGDANTDGDAEAGGAA